MDHEVEYLGRLERLSGHPPGVVPVDFRFDTDAHPAGTRRGDSQTLGMVNAGAYGDEHTGFLLLSVSIWGNAAFEAAFMRALAGGEDGLHVWLWADRRTPEIPPTTSGVAAIRLLTRIKFDKFVRLGARRWERMLIEVCQRLSEDIRTSTQGIVLPGRCRGAAGDTECRR